MAKASGSTRKGGGKSKATVSRASSSKKTTKKAPAKKSPVKKTAAAKPAAKDSKKSAKPAAKTAKPVAKPATPAKGSKSAKSAATKPAKGAKPVKGAKPAKAEKAKVEKTKPTKAEKPVKVVAAKAAKPSGGKSGSKKKAVKDKPPPPPPPSLASMQAAASKLAALAGLRPVESGSLASGDGGAGKPRRVSRSPLSADEVAAYRKLLIHKRGEIAGDVSAMEEEALTGGGSGSLSHTPQHMAEQGTDTFDQSLSLDLAASQRKLLKEIDEALERMDSGTYGVCVDMGVPIGKTRLDAKPWAKHCIEAARLLERRGL